MPKVSIIVPVYNCEKYLQRCVSTLLCQTEKDIQIILVNDGSVDASGKMCDNFAAMDDRVLVIHQKNSGVSAARNAGLDAATGEFISFVDADDWVETEMVECAYGAACASCADMVLFDPIVSDIRKKTEMIDSIHFYPKSVKLNKSDIGPEELRFIAGTVWRFIYKRQMLERNKIRFESRLPLSEDRLFNIVALGCSDTMYYLRQPLYHYQISGNSEVSKYRLDMREIVLTTHEEITKALNQYWGASYIPIYECVNLVDGALLCVYNLFSPKNTQSFRKKYALVKEIVEDSQFHQAVLRVGKRSLRQNMLKHKCTFLLCMTGIAWNIKNSRQ